MRAVMQVVTTREQRDAPADEVTRLRAQLERVQGRRLDAPVLPVPPALADLLPGGGLRPGAVYSLARSTSLLLALLAQPSQAGSWCGVVGMPQLGVEAAEAMGVDLSRLVLIPDPGTRWLAVTATIADVLPVVAVRPAGRAPDREAARLAARLRDRGAVLLVQGSWQQAEAVLDVSDHDWAGLGRGHGCLAERTVTVTSSSRRWPVPRRGRVLLPTATGAIDAAPAAERLSVVERAAQGGTYPVVERAAQGGTYPVVERAAQPRDETRRAELSPVVERAAQPRDETLPAELLQAVG